MSYVPPAGNPHYQADETEIAVGVEEVAVSSENDPLLDPLGTGFRVWRPSAHHTDAIQTTADGKHQWTISGHDMQILTATVPAGETLTTEVGTFMFMHPSMKSDVELTCCSRGPSEGCGRILGGENCVKVHLQNLESNEDGYAGVTPNFPAKIIPLRFGVDTSQSLVAKGGAMMAQLGDVDVGFDLDCSPNTCCCAGLGICRQHIRASGNGHGTAFMNAGGTILVKQLGANETVVIDTRSIVAFEQSVQMGIRFSGRCCTCFLAGEGCFNTTFTGPGKLWIQSMCFERYKAAVTQTVEERQGGGGNAGEQATEAVVGAAVGGILGAVLGGD